MSHAYVSLIVLSTVYSMSWYKMVVQCSLVVYLGMSHLGQGILLESTFVASIYNKQNNKNKKQYVQQASLSEL